MATLPKQNQSEFPVLVGRRSTRLSVAVPISITGTDATGNAFSEHTFTLSVNKHGAEIATSHELAPGSEITIENISAGRRGQAKVIRRLEKRSANSPYEVSVELLEPENIWDLRFPPSDWEKDSRPRNGGTAGEQASAVEPKAGELPSQSASPHEAAAQQEPQKESSSSAPPEPVPTGEHAGRVAEDSEASPTEAAPLVASQAPNASMTVERRAQLQAKTEGGSSEVPSQPGAADRLEPPSDSAGTEGKNRAARSFEQKVQVLSERLETTFSRLEMLLTRADQASGALQSETEKARAEIQEAGRTASDNLRENLRAEIERSSADFAQRTQERLRTEVDAAVETFVKDSSERLSRLAVESTPELQARNDQALDAATAAFSGKLKNFTDGIAASQRSNLQKSLEESSREFVDKLAQSMQDKLRADLERKDGPVETARLEIQAEIAEVGAKFKERCAQDAEQASQTLARELGETTHAVRNAGHEANSTLWESSKSIKHDLAFKAEKLRKEIAEIATTSEAGFRNYLEVQVTGAREDMQAKLQALVSKGAQEFSDGVQKTADAQLEASSQQLHRQAEDALELSIGGLESAAKKFLEDTTARLETISREKSESLSSQTRAAEDRYRSSLETTFRDFLARSTSEMERALAKLGDEKRQALNREIEAECARVSARIAAEIQARSEAVAKQAADTVYKQVGVATVVLKDWGDQAAARLEAQLKNSLETYQKQLAELSTAAREADLRHAEAISQETQSRLEQASRILRGEPGKTPGE
jgi:hypothetical protein